MKRKYLLNNTADLEVGRGQSLTTCSLIEAIETTHEIIAKFTDFPVDVFALLGMRNLSSFFGEVFGASVINVTGDKFRKNPHQDGYPDLLLMDHAGAAAWAKLSARTREKTPFSPFSTGGVEIKATCGNTPTAKVLAMVGMVKPGLGEQRAALLKTYDWKAHHRDTNHLLGIFWDFLDGVPAVVGIFYSNKLRRQDWGEIVQPREDGGRTTSVSIMARTGIRKMYEGWVVCLDDTRYIDFFNRYNGGSSIPRPQGDPGLSPAMRRR